MIGPDLFKLGDPPAPALAPVPPDLFKLVSFGTPSCRQVGDWPMQFLIRIDRNTCGQKEFFFLHWNILDTLEFSLLECLSLIDLSKMYEHGKNQYLCN